MCLAACDSITSVQSVVVAVRAAGDLQRAIVARRLDERRELSVQVGVVLRPHVAAAAPGFVADAEVRQPPRLVAPVLAAQLRRASSFAVGGHVLDPLRHLLRRARADVAGHIGVGADQLREVQELVRAESVGLLDSTPVRVDASPAAGRAGRCRRASDTRRRSSRRASAPPAPCSFFKRGDDIVAIAARVGNRGVLADPDAFVDAATEMLGELAVDVATDLRPGLDRRESSPWRKTFASPGH